MTNDIHILDKHLGTKYKELDDEGFYLGCLLPVYLLFPDSHRFKPTDKFLDERYILKNTLKNSTKIDYASNFGDVVIIQSFGKFHFFVFIEPRKYAHISEGSSLCYTDIGRLTTRIVGTYRHKGD